MTTADDSPNCVVVEVPAVEGQRIANLPPTSASPTSSSSSRTGRSKNPERRRNSGPTSSSLKSNGSPKKRLMGLSPAPSPPPSRNRASSRHSNNNTARSSKSREEEKTEIEPPPAVIPDYYRSSAVAPNLPLSHNSDRELVKIIAEQSSQEIVATPSTGMLDYSEKAVVTDPLSRQEQSIQRPGRQQCISVRNEKESNSSQISTSFDSIHLQLPEAESSSPAIVYPTNMLHNGNDSQQKNKKRRNKKLLGRRGRSPDSHSTASTVPMVQSSSSSRRQQRNSSNNGNPFRLSLFRRNRKIRQVQPANFTTNNNNHNTSITDHTHDDDNDNHAMDNDDDEMVVGSEHDEDEDDDPGGSEHRNRENENDDENDKDSSKMQSTEDSTNTDVTANNEPSSVLELLGHLQDVMEHKKQQQAEEGLLGSALYGHHSSSNNINGLGVDNIDGDNENSDVDVNYHNDNRGYDEDDDVEDNSQSESGSTKKSKRNLGGLFSGGSKSNNTQPTQEDKTDRFRRYLCVMIGCLTVAIVAIAVVIVVALVGFFRNNEGIATVPTNPPAGQPTTASAPTPAGVPTLSSRPGMPTAPPAMLGQPNSSPNLRPSWSLAPTLGPLPNDSCDGAPMIPLSSGQAYHLRDQSTFAATLDDTVATCGEIRQNGAGMWYSMVGQGRYIRADTCNSTGDGVTTEFDTQLSVYAGDCLERLICVTGNDQYCGDQSMVYWYGEPGQVYYLLAHGFREQDRGRLGLTVQQDGHDSCETALPIPNYDGGTNLETRGSTRGAAVTEEEIPPICTGLGDLGRGVWYSTFATQTRMSAIVTSETAGFVAFLSVYAAPCSQLVCAGSTSDFLEWEAEIGAEYRFFISGGEDRDSSGEFTLELLPKASLASGFVDPNSACTTHTRYQLVVNGTSVRGSTTSFGEPGGYGSCGDSVIATAAGLWYWAVGTGGSLTVSTCDKDTDFDTQISVFTGTCGNLQCVDGNDQFCGSQSSVSWFSQPGQLYLIHIHGFASRLGSFSVTLTESSIPSRQQFCSTAMSIEPDGKTMLGRSDVNDATNPLFGFCDVPDSPTTVSPGSWYRAIGDGKTWTASTCSPSTTFPARVSVYTTANGQAAPSSSCTNLVCVEYTTTPCGNNQHAVTFATVPSQPYWFLLHGPEEDRSSSGDFVWTLERTAANDRCETAMDGLNPNDPSSSSLMLGSTRGTTADTNSRTFPICARDVTGDGVFDTRSIANGRSVWYRVHGTGSVLVADACFPYTNFQIQLVVLRGSCTNLACATTGRGTPCSVEWPSTENELYYVVVQGETSATFGNYGLTVRTQPN